MNVLQHEAAEVKPGQYVLEHAACHQVPSQAYQLCPEGDRYARAAARLAGNPECSPIQQESTYLQGLKAIAGDHSRHADDVAVLKAGNDVGLPNIQGGALVEEAIEVPICLNEETPPAEQSPVLLRHAEEPKGRA